MFFRHIIQYLMRKRFWLWLTALSLTVSFGIGFDCYFTAATRLFFRRYRPGLAITANALLGQGLIVALLQGLFLYARLSPYACCA